MVGLSLICWGVVAWVLWFLVTRVHTLVGDIEREEIVEVKAMKWVELGDVINDDYDARVDRLSARMVEKTKLRIAEVMAERAGYLRVVIQSEKSLIQQSLWSELELEKFLDTKGYGLRVNRAKNFVGEYYFNFQFGGKDLFGAR